MDLEPEVQVSDIKDGTVFVEEVVHQSQPPERVKELMAQMTIGDGLKHPAERSAAGNNPSIFDHLQ